MLPYEINQALNYLGCQTCNTRQPGEDRCEQHPEISAYQDQTMTAEHTTPNHPENTCHWITAHNKNPQTATHVLATICDKCATTTTVTICEQCASTWETIAPNSRCQTCNGTLSWKTQNIHTGAWVEKINQSQLP